MTAPKRDEAEDVTFRFECDKCAMPLWYDYENAVSRGSLSLSYQIAHEKVRERHKELRPECKGDMYYQGWDWRRPTLCRHPR